MDSHDQLAIVQKYERFVNYFYPVAQNIPRAQGVLREMFIRDLLGQVNLFIVAGKSNHIGRLYEADVYNLKIALNGELGVAEGLSIALHRRHKTRDFLLRKLV